MGSGGPTYRGNLPYTDEAVERLINAVSIWVSALQLGMLRVTPFDSNGVEISPSGVAASSVGTLRKAVTTAGSREQVVVASTACKYVLISADLGNTNPVVVGGNGVVAANDSQQGIVVIPGNDPVRIDINDVNLLYVDSQSNGDAISVAYFN